MGIFLIILGVFWFAVSLLFVLALAVCSRRPCPDPETENAIFETVVPAEKPPVINVRASPSLPRFGLVHRRSKPAT